MYDRKLNGKTYTFGVSGKLYRDNLVLYDRETNSLWSQLRNEAIAGPLAGATLGALPATVTTWAEWRRAHPQTRVLSTATGYRRDYARDPYEEVAAGQPRGLGVVFNGQAKIYPLRELARAGDRTSTSVVVKDEFAGRRLTLRYDRASDSATIEDSNGAPVPHYITAISAWKAFYPKTEQFRAR